MKNIKNFKNFINEELKADTYLSAAEKLKEKGHKKRSKDLINYTIKLKDKLKPIIIEVEDEKYTLDSKNIEIFKSKDESAPIKTENLEIHINFDLDLKKNIENNNYNLIWEEDLSEKRKNAFIEELNEFYELNLTNEQKVEFSEFGWDELELNYQNKEFFKEWIDMNYLAIRLVFEKKLTENKKFLYRDGLIINDRKTALKLFKFLKEYSKLVEDDIAEYINTLTVNDLYSDL